MTNNVIQGTWILNTSFSNATIKEYSISGINYNVFKTSKIRGIYFQTGTNKCYKFALVDCVEFCDKPYEIEYYFLCTYDSNLFLFDDIDVSVISFDEKNEFMKVSGIGYSNIYIKLIPENSDLIDFLNSKFSS